MYWWRFSNSMVIQPLKLMLKQMPSAMEVWLSSWIVMESRMPNGECVMLMLGESVIVEQTEGRRHWSTFYSGILSGTLIRLIWRRTRGSMPCFLWVWLCQYFCWMDRLYRIVLSRPTSIISWWWRTEYDTWTRNKMAFLFLFLLYFADRHCYALAMDSIRQYGIHGDHGASNYCSWGTSCAQGGCDSSLHGSISMRDAWCDPYIPDPVPSKILS